MPPIETTAMSRIKSGNSDELPKIKAEIDNHNSGIKREYGGRGKNKP